MFTYLRTWFSMVYRLFFPKPKKAPQVWDPIILDETPIFSTQAKLDRGKASWSRTIGTNYAPIKDSLSYRRTRRAINRRRSTPGYNNYSADLTYSRIT